MRLFFCLLSFFSLVYSAANLNASPEPPTEYQRFRENLAVLKKNMTGQLADKKKFVCLAEAMRQEPNADHRREFLNLASIGVKDNDARESFLVGVLQSDADYMVRSNAASLLGKWGTEAALQPLRKAAASDAITHGQAGCLRSEGTARFAAIFALAEWGRRFPKSGAAVTKEIRCLPETDLQDKRLANEHLDDARRWALYQLTEDRSLLATEFKELQNTNAEIRCQGVVAFRFLNLKTAPHELVALAKDPSTNVRSSVALTLGEINDPKTIPLLIELAKDPKMDRSTRCNAIGSLGRMRATKSQSVMEQLLNDDDLKTNAAIALSQITGKRHALAPNGYGGPDWPCESNR